jgi:hypothetical protein
MRDEAHRIGLEKRSRQRRAKPGVLVDGARPRPKRCAARAALGSQRPRFARSGRGLVAAVGPLAPPSAARAGTGEKPSGKEVGRDDGGASAASGARSPRRASSRSAAKCASPSPTRR